MEGVRLLSAFNPSALRVAMNCMPIMLLLFGPSGAAQDLPRTPVIGRLQALGTNSSPIPVPKEDDTTFVVDSGPGLDTPCTFRKDGPLRIHLSVTRYVGPVNGDGTLVNPHGLISAGVLSPRAHLRMPVFDVDIHGDPNSPSTPVEVDHIIFNGHKLEPPLTGDNQIWKENDIPVPIEYVRFPSLGAAGTAPSPADNVVEISIDELSTPDNNWCTAAD
jgi:triacylglycerol lipase